MVSTIPEFRPVVGKTFVPSSGKSIRLSPACVCRFFFLERGCVRSNWQERPVHPRFWHDLDSILPGPQCTSNRLISRWKDGSKKTRSLQKGLSELQPFLWPRKFVQAGNSLKKASVYNPTTSKRPRVRHLSRKVFSWSFRICDISGREANASSISRIRDLSCCALSQWGIFASRKFRIVDFSYPGFVIRPPVVSGSFRRGVFRRGVVSNATQKHCTHTDTHKYTHIHTQTYTYTLT